jgi:single-strand DNA-binding protein
MNQVILIGRSGAQGELQYTKDGKPILKFSLATSERGRGEGEFTTSWHRIVVFGKQAEEKAPLILKGSKITVVGKINYNEWTDKNNNKIKSVDILAFQVEVGQPSHRSQESQQQGHQSQAPVMQGGMEELDIPF